MIGNLRRDLAQIKWSPELIGILAVYFAQGAMGLARLATSFYFKDQLGLSPAQVAALSGIAVIPWTIKPLYGWLSDTLPMGGYRRRPYLLLSGLLGGFTWLAMALWVNSAWAATLAVTIGSLAVAISDVIVDSLIVERSRQQDWAGAGSLQSLSWATTAIGAMVTAYLGGALLEHYPPQVIFALTASLPLFSVVAAWLIHEEAQALVLGWDPLRQQVQQVWSAVKQPALLLPMLFVLILQSTPSSDVAFFYFVTNDLGFGPEFLGQVRLATSIASLVGVLIFQVWLRQVPLRPLFGWITVISMGLGMTSLILVFHLNRQWGIDDRWFSLGDSLILTIATQIAYMPVLVMAARLCPTGIEATVFALLMSVFNLGGFFSHELGSLLMRWVGVTETDFHAMGRLVLLTNFSTLLPLLCLGWLPKQVLDNRADPDPSLQDLLQDVRHAEVEAVNASEERRVAPDEITVT